MGREAYLSAEQGRSQAAPRLPQAHADGWRAQNSCAAAREGPQAPVCLRQVPDGRMSAAQAQPPQLSSARVATLKRRAEFLRARKGARAATSAFVLEARRRTEDDLPIEGARFGFTVSKQVGNAVERNRVKRRLRAAVRDIARDHARRDFDYVLIARRAALDAGFSGLVSDLIGALGRVHATPTGKQQSRTARPEKQRPKQSP